MKLHQLKKQSILIMRGGNQPNLQVIHEEAIHDEAIHDEAIHDEAIQEEAFHKESIHDSAVHDQNGMQEDVQPLRRNRRVKKPSQQVNTKVYFNNNAIAHPI